MNILLRTSPHSPSMEVHLDTVGGEGGDGYSVRFRDVQASVRGRLRPDGTGWISMEGRRVPFAACRSGSSLWLWIRGRHYSFEIVDRTARRAGAAQAVAVRNELTAPMPGTILKIRVAEGEDFAAHQPLIIMESMKMEMTLSVPHAGRVVQKHCREGQLVEMGAVLMKLDPAGDA